MRKFAAVILCLCFAALGSGAVEFLHNAQHAADDAREALAARDAGQPLPQSHHHDESNCAFHLQLHLPALPVVIAPPATHLRLWVHQATLKLAALMPRQIPARLDCRGPPAIG